MTRVLLSFDNVVFICYCDSWGISVLVLWSRTAWLVLVEFCSEQLGVRYISSHYSLLEEKLITSLPILQNMVISDRYYRICSLIVRSGNFNIIVKDYMTLCVQQMQQPLLRLFHVSVICLFTCVLLKFSLINSQGH